MLTLEGIYDGEVVRLLSKQSLPANIPVKILVEDPLKENQDVPVLGEDYSFLKVAMQAKLRWTKDFSENINEYLDLGEFIKKQAQQLTTEKQVALSVLLETQWETGGHTFKREDIYNERLDTTFGKS